MFVTISGLGDFIDSRFFFFFLFLTGKLIDIVPLLMKGPETTCGCFGKHFFYNFHIRTVQHLDVIKVLFIHQLMH